MRFATILATITLLAMLGCASQPGFQGIDPIQPTPAIQSESQNGHVSWGQWDIKIDPENLTASIKPVRDTTDHINVTKWLNPPNCSDCIEIIITAWDPAERIVDITLVLRNPTFFPGYDVKAILSNYDLKEFLEPDAYADFYTDGTTWDPYYTFATENEDNYFGNGQSYGVGFQVYFPVGASANATITVDACYPGPQAEPWKIDSVVVAGPLQNDNYHHISFIARIHDHQDDVAVVFVNLNPVGPSNVPMGDDSLHKDYGPNDGIWGLHNIVTYTLPGEYECWIKAGQVLAENFTYQKVIIEVIEPVAVEPPLYVVSMMHAEEQDFYMNETTFLGYADTLRSLQVVFDTHDAKIALQPDWTFIEGEMDFDPTLFSDLQAAGHGVDAHAHESEYDIGDVHDLLDDAGVIDTIVANGGFAQDLGDDTNWAAYLASFELGGTGEQMFHCAVAYKDASTQTVDSLYTPIRPSTTGDWMVHDPDGPIVYIPGAPTSGLTGSHPDFFTLLPDAVDHALAGRIPGRVNTFYWHDPVSLYSGSPLSLTRIAFWNILFLDYFNDMVDSGDVVWVNFNEMHQLYLEWEE